MQINTAELQVKLVKYTIVANAQFKFGPALQSPMWEIFQSSSHLINFMLHCFADAGWQLVKRFRKSVRPDLERDSHDYFGWRVV